MYADPISKNINTFSNTHISILPEESKEILVRLKRLSTRYFFQRDRVLGDKLKALKAENLTPFLDHFFRKMIKKGFISDPIKFLDRLASEIPSSTIQEAARVNYKDLLQEAKELFSQAKFYLEMTEEKALPSLKTCISTVLDGISTVIESIITAFGIGDFFKPAESDMQANFKSQKIMMLFAFFSMLSSALIPLLGVTYGGLIIGGTLLTIAALSAIWPFIKPTTSHLPANAKNWTKEIQQGHHVAYGRKESLDEMANTLKMKKHAMLLGPSRIGKSLTAKAFAQAIERGDYPELKGKRMFRINTGDIVGLKASYLEGSKNILNKISDIMGRQRNDIILVLDEIHMACKEKEKMADQLKTFLDEGGEFPYVIGITTTEEYENHIKGNQAFALRFNEIYIEKTSRDETLKILGDTVLKSHPMPLIEDGALEYLFKKSCDDESAPQPTTAVNLLKRCINLTERTQKSLVEKQIITLSNEIRSLRSQAAVSRSRMADVQRRIVDLKKQKKNLKKNERCKEKKALNKFFKTKDLLDHVTTDTYKTILKIVNTNQKTSHAKNEKQLKVFLLLHEFLGRALESFIRKKSEKFATNLIINKSLIDKAANYTSI